MHQFSLLRLFHFLDNVLAIFTFKHSLYLNYISFEEFLFEVVF